MKKKIVIFGAGSHSKVIFSEIIKLDNYNFIGFIDNFSNKGQVIIQHSNKKFLNLGSNEQFIKDLKRKKNSIYKNLYGIVGVGSNYKRKKIVNEIDRIYKNFKWETIISKNSILNGNIKIGNGTLIMSGAVINNQTKIGHHCIINTSSSIDHDNIFNDFSSTGPGVVSGGNLKVGKRSHLGIGSVIKNNISIGKNVVIGGNSYVNKNCVDNSLYFGVPAKRVKKRKFNESYL